MWNERQERIHRGLSRFLPAGDSLRYNRFRQNRHRHEIFTVFEYNPIGISRPVDLEPNAEAAALAGRALASVPFAGWHGNRPDGSALEPGALSGSPGRDGSSGGVGDSRWENTGRRSLV